MPKTRFIVLKFLVNAAIAILLPIVQNTPDLLLIGTAKPMLAAAFAVAVAMFEGEFAGALSGAFCGMLCDFFSYYRFGYYALMLFLCCLGVGLLVQGYMRPVVLNCCLFILLTMLLSQGIAFFFLFLIRGYEGTELLFTLGILPLCFYTVAMGIPAFFGVRAIHQWFQKRIEPSEG